MKLFTKFLPGLFLLIFALNSNAQETWSLQKCIDYALENNIQIKQQKLNTDYQGNLVGQAKSDRLPNLNAQIGNDFSFGRSLTYENTYENVNSTSISGYLGTNITLWNGFTLKNTIKQRELDLQASIQDLQKAKDDIMLSIAASYLEILFAEELQLVSEAQIEVTQQQINRTQKLVDAGSLAKGALLEIEAQLAQEELQLVNDQNRVQLAYLNLFQFLELPVSESFVVEKPELPEIGAAVATMNSMDVFKNAMNFRPEIKAAILRVESMKAQLEIAKGSQYPNLSFGANYYNNYNDNYQTYNQVTGEATVIPFIDQLKNNERYGFGFTLSVPIFNRFQVKNGISNSRLQLMDYEYRLQTSKNVLRKDIEQAYTNALAALNRYISSEKAVTSMQEAFRYVEEKFNVGMVNSVEYNQSKNNLTVAQSNLLQAKYEYIFRTKILDFYNGIKIEL
ncbi:MAG: TolC family protein [Prolixibacteraceae bacterium]|nr:TolC family protein [Prolixibacteraceae bacterium]MBN2774572.1 TolC family protein [Prolixibacteraceae bacterium]